MGQEISMTWMIFFQYIHVLMIFHVIFKEISSTTQLRRNVQKQLNRIENGQKLSGAVFFGRQGKLMVGSESDIQKAMTSKTILKNAIIAWNYLYLSDYCCQLSNEEQKAEVIESISRGSVIAWAHINMHGIYDFDRLRTKSFKSTISQMKALKI